MGELDLTGEDWINKTVPSLLGGLNLNSNTESMRDNEFLQLNNLIYDKNDIKKDTGYADFADIPSGVPGTFRNIHQHITASGTASTFAISNLSFYVLANSEANWHGVLLDGGENTTIDANVSGTDTVIPVAVTTNFATGDRIALRLDDGSDHISTIASVSAGVSITIDDAVPGAGVQATSGNSCIEIVKLAGTDDKQVFAITVPWNDELTFTNGIDKPHYYDTISATIKLVQNLPSSGDTICESIALFDSSLFLIKTIEGGSNFNQRVRWSDKADYTNWTTGDSGFIDLLDSSDDVRQARKLGPHLVVYRSGSIVRGAITNNALSRFQWDTMVTAQGIISSGGFADIGDRHLVVGQNKIYIYKGGFDFQEIGENVEDLLFGVQAEMADDKVNRLFCVYVKDKNDVLIFYQTGAGTFPDKCLRWHGDLGGVWSTREFFDTVQGFGEAVDSTAFSWNDIPGNWDDQTLLWNSAAVVTVSKTLLLCATDGQVEEYDFITADDDGNAKTFTLETPDFSHPNGNLRHDYLELKGTSGIITVSYSTDEGITFNILEVVTIGTTPMKVRLEKQFVGRSIRYKIEGSSAFSLSWFNIRVSLETEN
jgi:heme-degrading monooxygenase HmoA